MITLNSVAQGNYINGEKEGVWKVWHENGHLELQANYINGKLEGLYKRWDENGKLINSTNYRIWCSVLSIKTNASTFFIL